MSLNSRVKLYRNQIGLTQEQLSNLIDIDQTYISAIEKGKKTPSLEVLQKIASVLKVTTSELLGEITEQIPAEQKKLLESTKELDKEQIEAIVNLVYALNRPTKERYKIEEDSAYDELSYVAEEKAQYISQKILIIGKVAAGTPIEAIENRIGEVDYTTNMPNGVDFGLVIEGDSMSPDIKDGSIVWVKKQSVLENGEIGVIMLNREATCKKFYKYPDRIELHSINTKYNPIIIDDGEPEIIGKVLV